MDWRQQNCRLLAHFDRAVKGSMFMLAVDDKVQGTLQFWNVAFYFTFTFFSCSHFYCLTAWNGLTFKCYWYATSPQSLKRMSSLQGMRINNVTMQDMLYCSVVKFPTTAIARRIYCCVSSIVSDEKPFKCSQCESSFRKSSGLKQHVTRQHSQSTAEKTNQSQANQESSRRGTNSNDRPYACQVMFTETAVKSWQKFKLCKVAHNCFNSLEPVNCPLL